MTVAEHGTEHTRCPDSLSPHSLPYREDKAGLRRAVGGVARQRLPGTAAAL